MTEKYTEAEKWRYRANLRQGIISKLEKKLIRAEAEMKALRDALDAVSARLALYDRRERA